MENISYMEPNDIETGMFYKKEQGFKYSPDPINSAVSSLKKYSMITGRRGVINVHRLVQRVIQLKIRIENREIDVVRRIMENVEFASWNESHFISVWKIAEKYDELIQDYGRLPAQILDSRDKLKEIQGFLPRMEQVLPPDHEFTLLLRVGQAFGIVWDEETRDSDQGWEMLKEIYIESCNTHGVLSQVTTKIVDRIIHESADDYEDLYFIPLDICLLLLKSTLLSMYLPANQSPSSKLNTDTDWTEENMIEKVQLIYNPVEKGRASEDDVRIMKIIHEMSYMENVDELIVSISSQLLDGLDLRGLRKDEDEPILAWNYLELKLLHLGNWRNMETSWN